MRTLVVCSGGLDSVTLSHKSVVEETLIHLVSFVTVNAMERNSNMRAAVRGGLG